MASEDLPLFNWYLRYPVGAADMDQLQDSLVTIPRDTFGELHAAGLLYGGAVAPSGALSAVTVAAFSAINDDGYLCVKNSATFVDLANGDATNPRYDLIVARPLLEADQTISRPTPPFDNVSLYELQNCQVVAIQGTPAGSPSLPSKVAGDVILASVYVPAGATDILSQDINQTTHHDIGRTVRFNDYDKKTLVIRARSGNTNAIMGYGSGSGFGLVGFGGASGSGAYGEGVTGGYFTGSTYGIEAIGPGNGSANTHIALRAAGHIKFSNQSPNSDVGINNTLTPMGLVKAWARIGWSATNPTILAGMNVTNPRYQGGTGYGLFDLVESLDGDGAVVVTPNVHTFLPAVGNGKCEGTSPSTVTVYISDPSTAPMNLSTIGSASYYATVVVLGPMS